MKLPGIFQSDRVWFMSDLHINHVNVIRHDSRPFDDLSDMHAFIEQELTTKLKKGDILFDLGDLFWSMSVPRCKAWLDKIPATEIYKVMGNHDKYNLYRGNQKPLADYFQAIGDIMDIVVETPDKERYRLTLSHYPILSWNHKSRGSIMVHGHCHGHLDQYNNESKDLRFDIGFSSEIAKNLGSPLVPFSEVLKKILEKTGGKTPEEYVKENYNNIDIDTDGKN